MTEDSGEMLKQLISLDDNGSMCENITKLLENTPLNIVYDMLISLIKSSKSVLNFNVLWKYERFRLSIVHCKVFTTGYEYETESIFSNCVTLHTFDNLVSDKNTHDTLVTYIHKIFDTNRFYEADDLRYIDEYKCSSMHFNHLLFSILREIIGQYNIENVSEQIRKIDDVYFVVDYGIGGLGFFHKLYVTMCYAIKICITVCLRHILIRSLLGDPSLNYTAICCAHSTFVEQVFILYEQVCVKILSPKIVSDLLMYVNNSYVLRMKCSNELYNFVTKIMGNDLCDSNSRFIASQLTYEIIQIEGYEPFDDLFSNIFKLINDVDFFKMTTPLVAISHLGKILELLVILLEFPITNMDHVNTSGTMFNLLKMSLHLYGNINNIVADVIMMTLNIHNMLYSKKIITVSYPEVEEKYVTLIGQLIFNKKTLSKNLVAVAFTSLANHIDYTTSNITKIKDIIMDNINDSILNNEEKAHVINKLASFDTPIIDYPAEFMDPLLCTLITDPIKIPKIDEIFDKSCIMAHIHETHEHPYTREKLTIDIITEYNNRPEIIKDIEDFKNRKLSFEQNAVI